MRSLWWWVVAGLVALLLLKDTGSSYVPLPKITNRTFIKQYIDAHNDFRSGVRPTASNMLYMTFDLALARIARAWASKCVWNHNPGTKYHPDPKFKPCGENMWLGGGRKGVFNPANAIRAFYQEDKYYDYNTHKCSAVCGHYTQVVWAKSYKVGCAIVFCHLVDGKKRNTNIFVCNYGPAGNYAGVRPFKSGQPCSECPGGDTCRNNLCSYSRWYPPFEYRIICDESCIAVAVLRPLLSFLAFAAVYYIHIKYPNLTV